MFMVAACKKKEIYSVIPLIEYKTAHFYQNAEGVDTLMVLVFSFKDGDGDIGLTQADTSAPFNPVLDPVNNNKLINPYYNNLYIDYFELVNGTYQSLKTPFGNDTLRYPFRFESLTPEGRHKAIRGDIEVGISPVPLAYNPQSDTVMYRFFIYDRALHKSNIAESPALIWKR